MGVVREPKEIDWDRIDKRKFFGIGIGAFSAVTTMLYPLSVLKTNQQTAPSTQTTSQTFSIIWRSQGLPGFYRGYTTVVFGMIPSRLVYLGSLEFMKGLTSKAGKHLQLDEATLAGTSNFFAAGVASSITNLVSVPVEVIAQRQMVHSSIMKQQRAAGGSPSVSPVAQSGPVSQASPGGIRPGDPAAATGCPTRTVNSGIATPGSLPSPSVSVVAGSDPSAARNAINSNTAGPSGRAGMHSLSSSSSSQLPQWRWSRPWVLSLSEVDGSSSQRRVRWVATSTLSHSAATVGVDGTRGGPGALSIIRTILKEEGVMGFYRGFGASMATFVPSSAVWWGSYGLYQKLAWGAWDRLSPLDHPSSLDKDSVSSAHASDATLSHASTLDVVMVQLGSSVLAGCTAAGLTAPLDLIKTRIQVARKIEGQATTFRAVASEVWKEGGLSGMFRAIVPRMASSALWGTAMVSVYEGLKRVSVRD